ncbi:hypothetical protein I551_3062 [Mycobacterium ulcerans str. Harvey]|uniref:Uncharacterized protein n=1 Tax=Mycobacterium ulcerans str. Harvey TaxID=1299332 RepID=A0ABP3AKY2_MYCUL|nr:hypothetical protein I551_3062 [Mycobacterium ulcerans str. Harvey]
MAVAGAPPFGQPDAAPYGPRTAVRQLLLWEDDDPVVAKESH